MAVPFLDLQAQNKAIRPEIDRAIRRVVESQRFILGPEVEALEARVAEYSGCRYGVGVSSGTDAILASLMSLGISSHDEVVTTAYSFFATAGCIARVGARPVFVDIDPSSFNLDSNQVEQVITDRTRAILPVHLFGQIAEMGRIMEIASRHNLPVIEDAAQAIGAADRGCPAGSIGDSGCLSFFPSKNLGGFGDGGMVVTRDEEFAARLRLYRNHGFQPKYFNRVVGGNFRLDALQAAILNVKLQYLEPWTEARKRNARIYRMLFERHRYFESSGSRILSSGPNRFELILPSESPSKRHVYNQFVIRINSGRDQLHRFLRSHDIGSEVYYPLPLHLQDCFADLGHRPGDFPNSERASKQSLALPIYPELSEAMISEVVETIGEFTQGAKGNQSEGMSPN